MDESEKFQITKESEQQLFSDEKENVLMAKIVSATMAILGFTMAAINFLEGNMTMVITSLVYGPIFLAIFIITLITKKSIYFLVTGFVLSFAMEFVYLLTGGQEGFGIFWMCIITFLPSL